MPKKKTKAKSKVLVQNDKAGEKFQKNVVQNGMAEVILGLQHGTQGVQLSQVDTIFKNLRYYLISNMRQPLSQAYVEIGLIQTVVDVPVDDGMRGGVVIKSKELDPEEIEKLQVCMEEKDDIGKVGQAGKWKRLFGGSGIVILTDQPMESPLEINLIKEDSNLAFRAVDMWELFWDKQNVEGDGTPFDNENFEHYNYYGHKLHKSRVLIMKGTEAPSFIRPRLRGWGVSEVEKLVRSINQFLKTNDLTFEVLDEFKLDVFRLKNLASTLVAANGAARVQQRLQQTNMNKNYLNAIVLDSEDEFDHKQLSFTGLAEVMEGARMQIASDLRMPLTKLFGISAAGFSSGEDDIENYNAMVESTIRSKCKHIILQLIKLRCQQLFGYIPDDLTIEFKPLRQLSSEQEENVKTQKFNRIMAALSAGAMTPKEFKDACNKDNLLGVQVDASVDLLDVAESDDEESDAGESKGKKSSTTAKDAPEAKD